MNPTYRSLGDHSEAIEIDFDPDSISYQELLDIFWQTNAAVVVPNTRQYYSIIFYHTDEQKALAEQSYRDQLDTDAGTVVTEIVSLSAFYLAEEYHQKYYLQGDNTLMQGFRATGIEHEDFINSTAAARLNGYSGSYGDLEILNRDIDTYGLTEAGKARLLGIAGKGVSPVCGSGLALFD